MGRKKEEIEDSTGSKKETAGIKNRRRGFENKREETRRREVEIAKEI